MGVSTDAIVCYGIRLGDFMEDTYTPPGPEEWQGAPESWVWDEEEEVWRYAEGHKYAGEEVEDVFYGELTGEGVEVVSHCSNEYPKWIAAVKGLVQTAKRGYEEELEMGGVVPSESVAKLRAWFEKWKIPIPAGEEPKWWLCSYWG